MQRASPSGRIGKQGQVKSADDPLHLAKEILSHVFRRLIALIYLKIRHKNSLKTTNSALSEDEQLHFSPKEKTRLGFVLLYY